MQAVFCRPTKAGKETRPGSKDVTKALDMMTEYFKKTY